MLSLLGLPDFAQAFVSRLALANLPHLRIKILESASLLVRWDLDRALLGNQRDLIISVLVGRAVENGSDPFTDCHVIGAPTWIEKDAVTILRRAIGKCDEHQLALVPKEFFDLAFERYPALELEVGALAFSELCLFPFPDG